MRRTPRPGRSRTRRSTRFCTYFTDRQSNRIGNNSCGVRNLDDPDTPANEANNNNGRGPRGAATAASLARQEEKLVNTIKALDADIIALEEIENSIKLPARPTATTRSPRDRRAPQRRRRYTKWKYVKSPGEATNAGAVAEQDVIRPAFIYQPAPVTPVGQSDILFGTTQFANAREPLAQAFKAAGRAQQRRVRGHRQPLQVEGRQRLAGAAGVRGQRQRRAGVGAFNGDRVRQATRLVEFANDFAADRDIEAVFLAGDFNAYTRRTRSTVLEDGGYELIESDDADEETYSFSGLSGSLDHVLGNTAAMDMVTGADIWEINANESVAYQYSRYNYNATNFFGSRTTRSRPRTTTPRSSASTCRTSRRRRPKKIQVLGTNDFHGRLLPDGGNAAGAAPFATAVDELRAEAPEHDLRRRR